MDTDNNRQRATVVGRAAYLAGSLCEDFRPCCRPAGSTQVRAVWSTAIRPHSNSAAITSAIAPRAVAERNRRFSNNNAYNRKLTKS